MVCCWAKNMSWYLNIFCNSCFQFKLAMNVMFYEQYLLWNDIRKSNCIQVRKRSKNLIEMMEVQWMSACVLPKLMVMGWILICTLLMMLWVWSNCTLLSCINIVRYLQTLHISWLLDLCTVVNFSFTTNDTITAWCLSYSSKLFILKH